MSNEPKREAETTISEMEAQVTELRRLLIELEKIIQDQIGHTASVLAASFTTRGRRPKKETIRSAMH